MNTDAMVVSSLIVTLAGGLLPITVISAKAGLPPPALSVVAWPWTAAECGVR
jgi:hypothetical protein